MAWTELTRSQHARAGDRYASDLTDAEWALLEPLMPAVRRVGRPQGADLRDVFDAILSIATTGCRWRMLPNDFPPVSKVRGCFCAWCSDGLPEEINGKLAEGRASGRGTQSRADGRHHRQPERKTTESGGGVRGYDAGKRIKGRKRHIVTGTTGLPVALKVQGMKSFV